MKAIPILFLMALLSVACRAGEALGVKYDDVYLVQLNHPAAAKKRAALFSNKGEPSKIVSAAFRIRPTTHMRIDRLLGKDANFNNGKGDSRLQLYALVFYKEGKTVLSVSPNLTGGDLYASNRAGYDPRSLSRKQRSAFLDIVFLCLSRGEDSVVLPNKGS